MEFTTQDATHEIRPATAAERRMSTFGTGVLWGDLAVGLLVLAAGGLLAPALGLRDALLAAAIGSVIGAALLALVGRIGSETGVPTMVALRPALGMRGSWIASAMNITQLIGWAGLEFIIIAQAARAISDEFFGFEGYYLWLSLAAVLATVFALGGPVVVVRQFLERFGFWIVIAATAWLTWRLFDVYDIGGLWNDDGAGGFPSFWQGVDLAAALPVSWLPLVADYSRYARNTAGAARATFASYALANTWFFFLGAGYALVFFGAEPHAPNDVIYRLVDSMLPLTLGWMFLFVIMVDETDNAFANVYSTAVSVQNMVALPRQLLVIGVGGAAFLLALSVDLLGYETFLLLIGGVFVSLFGVMLADYFLVRGRHYDGEALFDPTGPYRFLRGFNPAGLLAWFAGFWVYIVTAQPLWVLEHVAIARELPTELTRFGGTVPSFIVSLLLYVALARLLTRPSPAPTAARAGHAG